jgi:DNA-binding PadR family transcriptional regulator
VPKDPNRVELLQGTLDMLILRTLVFGPAHGHQIAKHLKREFKYYRLTPAGKKQLLAEESKWKRLSGAIASVMWPAFDASVILMVVALFLAAALIAAFLPARRAALLDRMETLRSE